MQLGTRREWGNAEIAKPLNKRHPIMQWYEQYLLKCVEIEIMGFSVVS
jgi:predicted anti-sigma-YlaC factor YlaD